MDSLEGFTIFKLMSPERQPVDKSVEHKLTFPFAIVSQFSVFVALGLSSENS